MARPIGGLFLHAAHGPVAFAASCVAQNQILKGLEELAVDGLVGGLQRGVGEVAGAAGVPRREVSALLPGVEIAAVARRLKVTQPAAVEAWRMHAGAFGFLDVITQLTVDGRPVAIGSALERLAAKVRADEGLAGPLLALAEDVAAWEALVHRCRDLLDDGDALSRAWRLRRQRFVVTALTACGVIVSAVGVIAWTAMARARVDEALSGEPCAALGISPSDRDLASNDQDRALADAVRRCGENRAAEEAARARAERERVERARAEREAAERKKDCTAFAVGLSGPGGAAAPGGDRFAARLASRRLDSSDLGPGEPKMACWGEPGLPAAIGAAIDRAFFEAVLAFPGGWVHVVDPSPRTATLLSKRVDEVPPWQRSLLAARADRDAERALLGGEPEDAVRARRACDLAERLGMPPGPSCIGLTQLPVP